MNIAIACDHAGFNLKKYITSSLKEIKDYHIYDYGADNNNKCDYVDYAKKLCDNFYIDNIDYAILICGSGIGMSIVANRYKNIRAVLCSNIDHAYLSRYHNDANIICIGSRITNKEDALSYIIKFLNSKFALGRHLNRINKIDKDINGGN